MGQYSWITQDTNRSISSIDGSQFRVIMRDDKGNLWEESEYEGYGEFGGKDFFVLVAEMNGLHDPNHEVMRGRGISLNCSNTPHVSPSLSENGEWFGEKPLDCPDQGWVEYDSNGDRVEEEEDEEDEC